MAAVGDTRFQGSQGRRNRIPTRRKKTVSQEKLQLLTPEAFQQQLELLANNTPGLERHYAVVLLAQNQPQFYGIADCGRHQEARDRAIEEYRRTSPEATVPECIVFGTCNEPGCDCGHQFRDLTYRPLITVSVILCRNFAKLCQDARRGIPVFLETAHLIEKAEIIETPQGEEFHFPDAKQALEPLLQTGYTIIAIIPESGAPVYFPFGDGHQLQVAQRVLAEVLNLKAASQA
jgi:uncharacterized ParB-like nuclease family protein